MNCYRDRWYCTFYEDCKKGKTCSRSLTDAIRSRAAKQGQDIQTCEMPDCMDVKPEPKRLIW